MQQHTGQHLLSALLQSKLGLKTNSWWMAENSESEGPGFPTLNYSKREARTRVLSG
ncbi:Alanyl-tRNA synthetase domain-containing protein 1-B [Caligus rogercresseyi]|uniref:Alanyl-tRNA synthetase domain-containing protein 1-B n=1 Tax=Caligus rogercresseyi TaxID=217165 RepID=A0A7T8QUG7_CALRO|nr:Alanyl-tRNA synthetase domain-containing protein 1-B [Caligus rogercresseyi]